MKLPCILCVLAVLGSTAALAASTGAVPHFAFQASLDKTNAVLHIDRAAAAGMINK